MALEKRSFALSGHRTSVALEPAFWAVLEQMAGGGPVSALVARLDEARTGTGDALASALRVAALRFLQAGGMQGGAGPRNGPDSQESTP